jgi:hypothetical protein
MRGTGNSTAQEVCEALVKQYGALETIIEHAWQWELEANE